jgi:hypothetical protein
MHDNHDVVLKLSSYRGKQEKRVVPHSIRSMRNERGVSCADLHEISSGLLKGDDACGCGLSRNEQFIPNDKGLSVSGVRKELETAADKLQLFQTAPELVIQMLEHAVRDYKLLLKRLMTVVKIALKEYTSDMVSTGELDADDIEVLNTHAGQAVVVASDGFREFFFDWIVNDAPKSCKSIYKRAGALKLESIFNIAKLGTIDINDTQNAARIVKHLDSICDIVIVSFHGGAEGSTKSNITRSDEIFLGENRGNPYKFARIVIDAGADVVFGHGPHVTRAIDMYKGRFIAYSLGNFATYGRFNLKGICGVAPIIKLAVNKKGEFLSGNLYSIKQIGEGGPIIDDDQMALKEVIKLTQSDIPESPLLIKSNGLIYKK